MFSIYKNGKIVADMVLFICLVECPHKYHQQRHEIWQYLGKNQLHPLDADVADWTKKYTLLGE